MNIQIMHNKPAAIEPQGELVTLWRLAILGDRAALQAFLRRVMPASFVDTPPAIIEIDALLARRRPTRAAA
jgi:hypothetical protein